MLVLILNQYQYILQMVYCIPKNSYYSRPRRPLIVTIRGDIRSFAAQKSPLTPESCPHGMRSPAHSCPVKSNKKHPKLTDRHQHIKPHHGHKKAINAICHMLMTTI